MKSRPIFRDSSTRARPETSLSSSQRAALARQEVGSEAGLPKYRTTGPPEEAEVRQLSRLNSRSVACLSEATIASYTSLPKSAFAFAIWRSSPAICKVQFGNEWERMPCLGPARAPTRQFSIGQPRPGGPVQGQAHTSILSLALLASASVLSTPRLNALPILCKPECKESFAAIETARPPTDVEDVRLVPNRECELVLNRFVFVSPAVNQV
eukprot:scaffold3801_cov124-Isochrysis_galbana.AAC.20